MHLVKLVNLRELGWRQWFSRSLSWAQTRVLSGDVGAGPFFFLAGVSPSFHFPVFLETVPPNKARSIGYSTWPILTGSGSVFGVPRRAWQRPGRVPGPWRLADSPSSGSLCHEGSQAVRSKGRGAAGTERVWVLSYSGFRTLVQSSDKNLLQAGLAENKKLGCGGGRQG